MPASFKMFALTLLLSVSFYETRASHIVGGEVTYRFLGSAAGGNKYEVSLTIYENCLNPATGAIAGDDPAYMGVFEANAPFNTIRFDSVHFSSAVTVPGNFSNLCLSDPPPICLIKKTFIFNYVLPPNSSGYIIAYQKCCRNESIVNIIDPGNTGSTYYCVIPPYPLTNNSAVFTNYPPQIICLNNPLTYDNSATDADGDSLSYEFCNALIDNNPDANFDPKPEPPPYDSVNWQSPYYYTHPMTGYPPIQINPVTGLITGTPNLVGRYLVTICCHEWRNGVLINTTKREFQFTVTPCTKAVIACIPQFSTDINTYIVDCKDYSVNFVNCSSGGTTWHWDFGVPGITNDTSDAFEPAYVYPDTGTFAVKLIVNPGSTCKDSITRFVKVYPKFYANFADSGALCPGDVVMFKDLSSATIKPITYWHWDFGDGDTSLLQNPVHAYVYGGTYNVILIAQNIKNCTDTAFSKILVDNFKPFAGYDTIIVKGENIQFNATGGIEYAWSPVENLDNPEISDPVGYYPDTGRFIYSVRVVSPYGCIGYDTIQITVVNQASFFVPTAFTPNGDGSNDIFRPVAVGYRALKYFRVFNRWGQQVFYSNNLEAGWDGTYGHKQEDMGTYYWEISFTDRFGNDSFLKGDVTLLR